MDLLVGGAGRVVSDKGHEKRPGGGRSVSPAHPSLNVSQRGDS